MYHHLSKAITIAPEGNTQSDLLETLWQFSERDAYRFKMIPVMKELAEEYLHKFATINKEAEEDNNK